MKRGFDVVFVHGIKTRQDDYDRLCHIIKGGFSGLLDIELTGVYWGDLCLNCSAPEFGKSLPYRSQTGSREESRILSKGVSSGISEPIAYSSFLSADAASSSLSSVATVSDPHLISEHSKIVASELLAMIPLANSFKTAQTAEYVKKFVENRCSCGVPLETEDLLTPLAAELLVRGYPLDSPVAGPNQGDQDIVSKGMLRDGLKKMNPWLTRAVIDRVLPLQLDFIADILRYFGDEGESISQRVSDEIERHLNTSTNPVLIIGHSLGGVIAFRSLAKRTSDGSFPLKTRGGSSVSFVSVGSQIGFLREIGFLNSPECLPGYFNWANIYSPGDFLSSRINPFYEWASDLEWETTSTFPASHSEYFTQTRFYEWLATQANEYDNRK